MNLIISYNLIWPSPFQINSTSVESKVGFHIENDFINQKEPSQRVNEKLRKQNRRDNDIIEDEIYNVEESFE